MYAHIWAAIGKSILPEHTFGQRLDFWFCPKAIRAAFGFLILPDLKWDQKDPRELDLLVLVHRRDLNTVRDLNQSHLPLLQNILHKSTKVISEKYKISVSLKIGAYGEYSQVTFKEQTFL